MYRILIVAPSWIGDTLMAQPLFRRLKSQHPDSILDVLAPPWVAPILARMPEVNRVIDSPFRHGGFDWAARKAVGQQLRAAQYDQAFVLPNSWKSALVPFFAGIPKRTGYQGEVRYVLLNDRHTLDKARYPQLVQRYAALAGELDDSVLRAKLQSSVEQQAAVRAEFGLGPGASLVVLCPGAEYGEAKRWPATHFVALAAEYAAAGHVVVILGSGKDAPIGEDITFGSPQAINLCGKTNLEQAMDLIASAHLVVSNDSGLMHVAAAFATPQVAIYGSSSPAYTPPMSGNAKIVSLNLPCSPCFERTCPLGHLKCLRDLSPQQVSQAAQELIAQH